MSTYLNTVVPKMHEIQYPQEMKILEGSSIASKAYQFAVNKYINSVDPEHKRSRLLYDGEYHIPLHNFSGPGTRIDLKEVEKMKPYNQIDGCSKLHDIAYNEIKNSVASSEHKANEIANEDKSAIECYDRFPNEYGHDLAKAAITGKVKLDSLYSLLKGKPSTIYGGLIHEYSNEALLKSRNPEFYTDDEKEIIDILKLNNSENTLVQPVGSFTYSIQKYPSDIDLNQIVTVSHISTFVSDLKKLIKKIERYSSDKRSVFFTDFKAGIDPNDAKKGLKWSSLEIIDGKKKVKGDNFNGYVYLEDALLEQSVIKLDIVVISHEISRIIEASTFFILYSEKDGKYVNVPQNFFDLFVDGVKKDILKYSSIGKDFKLFKAIKRMWSLARLTKDISMLQKLAPIIDSNLSLLGQINADIETIILLIEKYGKSIIKIDGIQNVLNGFEKRLSTIVDVESILENYDEMAKSIEILKNLSYRGWGSNAEVILERLHNQILDIINESSLEFMRSKDLWPIPKSYLPIKY